MTTRKLKATRLDKEFAIYGLSVHESGEVFAFNRDYYALERTPSRAEVQEIMGDPDQVSQNRAYGKGRYKPKLANDERGWTTYWRKLPDLIEWDFHDYNRQQYES